MKKPSRERKTRYIRMRIQRCESARGDDGTGRVNVLTCSTLTSPRAPLFKPFRADDTGRWGQHSSFSADLPPSPSATSF